MNIREEKRRLERRRELKKRRVMQIIRRCATVVAFAVMICVITVQKGKLMDATVNNETKIVHQIEVRQGDTLWSIADIYMDADHYGDKRNFIAEVMVMNKLTSQDDIKVGQTLFVPVYIENYESPER